MSETSTLTDPQPNAPSVDPPTPAPDPAPAADPAPAPADPPEPTEEEKTKARDEEGRRVAQMRARLGATERERDQLAAELAAWRARGGAPPQDPTPEQQQALLREQIRAEEAGKIRAERFHEEGTVQFPDWQKRCGDLMAMGADAGFAQLLVEMPGGVKVAAALADDPEEVQRISAIRNERGRAIALGRYAATLETVTGATARTQSQPVTRAPAPIRPVTGRASPQFDEYRASAQELVDHYLKPTPISARR
jgi:hypothetical protein